MKKELKIMLIADGLVSFYQCKKKVNISNEIHHQGKPKIDLENTKKLDSLDINFKLKGDCYTFSSKEKTKESNRETYSENTPYLISGSYLKNYIF
ncbi:hypothetical protein [Tenacibaculum sp. nBUS_03]|uniref:hypothetical protein n=1 Tax=Tenacibaculum sp. nBUS_03 TaxID=3395320 RepID=UPI003EB6AAD0